MSQTLKMGTNLLLPLFAALLGVAWCQSSVKLTVNPTSVWVGHTTKLTVNCSFGQATKDFTSLSFMVLSKTDTETDSKYKELAIVPGAGTSNYMDIKVDLGAHVTGQLQHTGDSFIAYEWDAPGDETRGKYKCEAHGVDQTGHPVTDDALAVVDGDVAEFDILVDMIQTVNTTLQLDTDFLERELKQWLQNHSSILGNQTNQISQQLAAIQALELKISNQTTQLSNNDTIEVTSIKQQLADLKASLLNQTNVQAMYIDSLRKELDTYKATVNGQGMMIANQTSQMQDLQLLLDNRGELLMNQTRQIDDMTFQLQGLLGLSNNQTSLQGAQLQDIQNQLTLHQDQLNKDQGIISDHNVTLARQQQQLDSQNLAMITLTSQLNNVTKLLQDQTAMMAKYSVQLDDIYSRVNKSGDAIFDSSFVYGGHTYYLSSLFWRNIPLAETLCQLNGGHLVQIDDLAEMNEVTNHLSNNHIRENVFVGGTDVVNEGVWHFGRFGPQMSYFNWASGFPSHSVHENCIMLEKDVGWKMENTKCTSEEWDRFVCEVY